MRVSYPYLKDIDFLLKIDQERIQEEYVKIVTLDWKENPLREVQGITTDGTLSLNGKSAIRRTCNLSAILNNNQFTNITEAKNIFSINKKIYLEIGIVNNTGFYNEYPIIWFPQGTFIIQNPTISNSLNGLTLSLQLKDKMCLLNGECGGTLPASTEFDKYETINENGELIITKPTIDQIIREAVNHFGGEQLSKIIISDIDKKLKTVMRWLGDEPLYLYQSGESYFLTTDYETAAPHQYKMFIYGDDVGFIYTDFVYIDELIGNAGDNVCTILDKIKSYLGGNYEYYYDVEGNFIFQEIKNYLNTTQATIEINNLNNENYKVDMSKGKSVYDFTNSPNIISINHTPQYLNIKNDYIVWGIRKTVEGLSIPIRYHLAIDQKPETGNIYKVFFYQDPEDNITKAKTPILYSSYAAITANAGAEGVFYEDISTENIYIWNGTDYELIDDSEFIRIKTTDWRSELYLQGVAAEPLGIRSNFYYTELLNEWPKLYNLRAVEKIDSKGIYYEGAFYPEVVADPSSIDYFLDFIDSTEAIAEFSINNIGRRSIVQNSNNYNCVFEKEVPDFVLIEAGTDTTAEKVDECIARNQAYIQVDSNIFALLAIGGMHNSCFEEIKNMLWQYTNYNNSINLSLVPIFHLEPNTRISIYNSENDLSGDFMIDSISIPLNINGSMSINAQRASEKL